MAEGSGVSGGALAVMGAVSVDAGAPVIAMVPPLRLDVAGALVHI